MNTFRPRAGRLLVLLLALALLTLPLTVSAAAADGEETAPAAPVTEVTEEAEEDHTPIATLISDFLAENAAGLLSGASFLLTLILSLALRKRILPPILDALTGLIGKSRDLGEALSAKEAEGRAELAALLREAEEILKAQRAAAERAEAVADALRREEGGRAEAALVLREQTALLYELLMSANLPEYQKERIGELHARITAVLSEAPNG